MTTKTKIVAICITVAISFAFGRFSAPTKIKEVTKVVEVDKKTTDTNTDRDKHKETTVTETETPDGTKTKVTKTVEDTDTKRVTKSTETDTKSSEQSKEVTKNTSVFTVDALIGFQGRNYLNPMPAYGIHMGVNVIGPIRVGAFGMSTGVGGVSVGLQF